MTGLGPRIRYHRSGAVKETPLLDFAIISIHFIPPCTAWSDLVESQGCFQDGRIDRSGPWLPLDTCSSYSNSVPVNHCELEATQTLTQCVYMTLKKVDLLA